MRKTLTRILPLAAMMLVLLVVLSATAFAAGDPTDEPGTKMIECPDCGTVGACMECYGLDPACEACGGTNVCAACGGEARVPFEPKSDRPVYCSDCFARMREER